MVASGSQEAGVGQYHGVLKGLLGCCPSACKQSCVRGLSISIWKELAVTYAFICLRSMVILSAGVDGHPGSTLDVQLSGEGNQPKVSLTGHLSAIPNPLTDPNQG